MSEPDIQNRAEQRYAGIRSVMPMSDFESAVPAMTAKVFEWLQAQHLKPSGKPFLRYHLIDMPERMDVELGIPIAAAPAAEGEVKAGTLPAGRYAVITYTGVKNGVSANKRLMDWIAKQREQAVSHPSERGEVFEARYETFLTDAKTDPDQNQWETEVAIKLRD